MKNFVSAGSELALALLLTLALAGCGGVSANPAPTPTPTPMPTPPGATPTPTPAAAHGTFIYFNNSNAQTAGYKLNNDGTLTLLSGSPFAVNGALAAAGNFLAVASGSTVSTFLVDPSSGALTKAGSGTIVQGAGAAGIAADGNNVYVAGSIPANTSTGIYGFALAANGMLTPLAGSPYVFTQACDFCDVPFALALNNNFLIQGGVGFHGVGDFTTYARGANGVLGKAQILGTDAEERVAIRHPAGSFSYALNTDDSNLNEFTIGASGNATPGATLFTGSGQDMVIDPANKFLLVVDNAGVVHVFTIDPATGSMSQIGTSEAAGNGAVGIAIDPSGRFVIVSQSASSTNLPGAANQITVFTFDPGSGAMKKLQSYPQPKPPGEVVMVAR
jgi:6-phosphogluconolactonase (cycloisomerase 2 family)